MHLAHSEPIGNHYGLLKCQMFKQGVSIRRGAAYLALVLLAAQGTPAFAVCTAANQYSFNFSSQAAASLSYASSYNYTATSAALGNQTFNVAFTSPAGYNAVTGIGTLPEISTDVNGGAGNALVMGGILAARTTDIGTATNVLVTTLTFPTAVRDVTFTLHDIDYLNTQFRDWIRVVGISAAGTYVPAITTPWSMANNTGPYTNASSSLKLGAQAAPVAVAASEAVGVGASGNNSTTGNLTASFAQPVTSVQLRYGNYPLQAGDSGIGQQFYALSAISWCPMPNLTVVKSSTPVVTSLADPNRFNIPQADTYYSISVTNSDSSPVDANTIVMNDLLPSQMTFFNGDIDGAGPLTTNFEFIPGTSGLTLGAANISYLNAANAGITPAAGYDPLVRTVRWAPQGTMAANSSFTIRLRTRIN
jgi:uncharacterized repeat protein (TIGR01451 family)